MANFRRWCAPPFTLFAPRFVLLAPLYAFFCLAMFAPLACADSAVVDRAEIKFSERYSQLEIKFHVPIDMRSFTPLTHGQVLQIEIELPSDVKLGNPLQLGSTEWIAGAQPNAKTLYEYLRFDRERDANRGRLIVKFLRDMNFSVYKSSDSRSVIVAVLSAELPKRVEQKVAGAPLQLPVPTPAPATAIAETKVEPVAPLQLRGAEAKPAQAIAPIVAAPAMLPPLAPPSTMLPALETPVVPSVPPPTTAPAPELAPTARANKNEGWRVYGGFSQYYRYAGLSINRSGDPRFNSSTSQTAESDLLSNIDLSARYRSDDWDIRSRFNGGYLADFLTYSRDSLSSRYRGNKALLSDAYIDVRNRPTQLSLKAGRQYGSSGGVLGRFDGVQAGAPIAEGLRVNVVAGSPVDLTRDKTVDDTNRYFYGVNLDIAPRASKWQYNIFAIQQQIDGIIDRRAVGSEVRYYADTRSLFGLIDYDVDYSALNRTMLIGNWRVAKATTVNLSLDYGESPTLTTRNALISQPNYNSIRELLKTYSESEVKQLARDRTAKSHNALLSATQELNTDLQLYGSIGQYYYGAMPASAGVEAMPATGNEYDYEVQLIASNWLQQNSTTSLGARYYNGSFVHRSALGADARYLFGNFHVNPRFWVELRKNMRDSSQEWVYRPGLRLEYIVGRRYHLEFDASSDLYKGKIPAVGNQDIVGNFIQIGYRIDLD